MDVMSREDGYCERSFCQVLGRHAGVSGRNWAMHTPRTFSLFEYGHVMEHVIIG
jgi:hypothetical protein